MKTFADVCLERAEKARTIAVQKHYSLEVGCDAWLELQKLDIELRDKIVFELARRLKRAIEIIRSCAGILDLMGDDIYAPETYAQADELEAMPKGEEEKRYEEAKENQIPPDCF